MDFVPNTDQDRAEMLEALGMNKVEELFAPIPEELKTKTWDLPGPMCEMDVTRRLSELAGLNATNLINFLGAGFYDHFIPAVIDALISRGEFYTAYTPYQAEMSQGTLQSIYEWQTAICRLTGMYAANASLYDGGTAVFEAAMMAVRKTKRRKLVLCRAVNPIYRTILESYIINLDLELHEADIESPADLEKMVDKETAAVILGNPDFYGRISDLTPYFEIAKKNKAISIAICNPISLAVLKTPAEMGADIVVGEAQSLGIPLSFGGPYVGFMGVTKKLVRAMPGRVVGRTADHDGNVGYCLTLQTREQHIRREKATSNICTNEALCALMSTVFLGYMGKQGLIELAELNMAKAAYAKARLTAIPGVEPVDDRVVFNEFRLKLPMDGRVAISKMIDKGFAAGFPLARYYPEQPNNILVAVTEKRTKEEIGMLAEALEAIL